MNSEKLVSREPRFGLILFVAAYGAALIAVPSDFGPRMLGFVLSPSRAILAALIIMLLVGGKLSLRSLRDMPRAVLVGWVLFLGSAAVSTFVHPSGGAIARYGSLVVEGFFLFWVVSVVAQSQSDVRRITLALVVTTIAVAVATMALGFLDRSYDGLFAGMSGAALGVPPIDSRFGLVRQQGSFPAPLLFGLWLSAASPLVLPYVERGFRGVRLASGVGWTLLFSAVVLATVSRMAITGMLAVAGAYFLLRRPRWLGAAALAVSLAVATGFASMTLGIPSDHVPPTVITSPAPRGSLGNVVAPAIRPTEEQMLAGSNTLRIEALQAAVKAVSQRPLFGWGLLTEKEIVSKIGGRTNYVDSSYLALLVNLGLVGFSAFLFLVLAIAYAARGARVSADGVSLVLATVSILTMSGLAAFLIITQGYALTWMLAALLIRAARLADARST